MMNKKFLTMGLLLILMVSGLSACSNTADEIIKTETEDKSYDSTAWSETESYDSVKESVNIGSLKGPTSMGLVSLMDQADRGEGRHDYNFTMVTAADELLSQIINGDLDIAMVPANVASVLYNKTEGAISVLNINTLGVLYIVESGEGILSIESLKGKTLYLTGKGTTPEYVMNYLLGQYGLTADDVTLEFKSEATEVAAVLTEQKDAIGLLPQPFVAVAMGQNEKLRIALDLTKEWDLVQGEAKSSLVTGVTVVRNEFLEAHGDVVDDFLAEYEASTEFTNTNTEAAAQLIVSLGIVANATIAEQAIPYSNITYIDGEAMKTALSGYLQVLYNQKPESVGGSMPGDDFYFISQ